MGQIEDLRAFALIVEHESIGKAAEVAGIAKSAMSRKLKLLEERMQTELITRTTRQWSITESGRQYYENGLGILSSFDEFEARIKKESQALSGEIRISLPLHFGRSTLSAPLLAFAKQHPGLHLRVDFTDRFVDVLGENYDFAVRISEPPENSLIATKVCVSKHYVCASQDYLKKNPVIDAPEDLRSQSIIQYGPSKRFNWEFKSIAGKNQQIPLKSSLNSDDLEFVVEATTAGLGVARIPDFIAKHAIASGKLMRVLDQFETAPRDIFTVYPATRHLSSRTQAALQIVIDTLSQKNF